MPTVDTTFILTLALVTSSLLVFLTVFFTYPFWVKMWSRSELAQVYGALFAQSPWSTRYLFAYLGYFAPFVGIVSGFCVGVLLVLCNVSRLTASIPPFAGFSIGGTAEIFLIKRKHAWKVLWGALGSSIVASLFSIFPFLVLFMAFLSRAGRIFPHAGNGLTWVLAVFFLFFFIVLHYIGNSLLSSWRAIPLSLMFTLVVVFFWPAYIAQEALHLLGIGGGVPIRIVLKSSSAEYLSGEINGCLILSTGSQLLVKITTNPGDCSFSPGFPLQYSDTNRSQITNLERSEVRSTIINPPK